MVKNPPCNEGTWVQSLVRELRSHRPQLRSNTAKKKRNKKLSGNLGCISDFWRHWATISQHTACRKTPSTFCYHNLLGTLMMLTWASQVMWVVKNLLANAGHVRDEGSVPRGGHGNSVQCFCPKNSTERGAWWATVCRVTKSLPWVQWLSVHIQDVDLVPNAGCVSSVCEDETNQTKIKCY